MYSDLTLTLVGLFLDGALFALHPNAGAGEMPRKQAIETVKNNIEWRKLNLDEIQFWLN